MQVYLLLRVFRRSLALFTVLMCSWHFLDAQVQLRHSDQIKWAPDLISEETFGGQKSYRLFFQGASYSNPDDQFLPVYHFRLPVNSLLNAEFSMVDVTTGSVSNPGNLNVAKLRDDFEVTTESIKSGNNYFLHITIVPLRQNSMRQVERLESFTLVLQTTTKQLPASSRDAWPDHSFLASGISGDSVYRFSVQKSGVYKLDYNFLKNVLNIQNLDNIHPNQVRVYGLGGQMLPELLSQPYFKELPEIAVHIQGDQNGQFNTNDYLVLYAEGIEPVFYNGQSGRLSRGNHLYTHEIHYLLKISSSTSGAKRIQTADGSGTAAYTTTTFDDVQRHEQDMVNLMDYSVFSSGSGKEWYGEHFRFTLDRSFNFSYPGLVSTDTAFITARFAARSIGAGSSFDVNYPGGSGNVSISAVPASATSNYAASGVLNRAFVPGTSGMNVQVKYNRVSSTAEGWLDYIEIMARRNLNYSGSPIIVADRKSIQHPETAYQVNTNGLNPWVWDVTDFHEVNNIQVVQVVNGIRYKRTSNQVRFFKIFEPNALPAPSPQPAVAIHNLHNTGNPDMVIVYHPEFEQATIQLAQHRAQMDGYSIATVLIQDIYNHFTGGHQDVSALRNYAKMMYDKNPNFKYLLLMGAGSFDPKNNRETNITNHFIVTYQVQSSLSPTASYTSDDFFALLDDHEGDINSGGMDIAIGRLPVRNAQEAIAVVQKIIHYEKSPVVLGDWLSRIAFVADDGDGSLHLDSADPIAEMVRDNQGVFNIDKIYLDAYPQVSTLGDPRYPQVTEAINNNIFRGVHILNYMGHGGPTGWAQQRVLQLEHMQTWENLDKLPLVVTATCTFGPFDDPDFLSGGEYLLVKPDGGAVGLFTTVRLVYASSNTALTRSTFQSMFLTDANGKYFPIGEILRHAKENANTSIVNSRKFALLGDPSMRLRLPAKNVVTTTINGQTPDSTIVLEALQHVTVTGEVRNPDGTLATDFNGIITPTVFDKVATLTTLSNTSGSPVRNFKVQRNVIFRGNASVSQGQFTFSFIVPMDINYEVGYGKISYHAHDQVTRHAHGYNNDFKIGGTNADASVDNQGPEIELYMNDESFVFGGLTDENPLLLVKLYDESGINITGSGIGHDMTAILDEDPNQTYILNEFYESALDDFRRGEVRYPLRNLEEGRHEINVKAWDVYNNSSMASTEFVVASKAEVALKHVLNYPNPFTTQTQFMFEHNLNDRIFDVQVQVYTISGRLIKTIQQQIAAEGNRVDGIMWDGLDDFGDRIGRGTYIYKVRVRVPGVSGGEQLAESDFEKLVILK